MRTNRLMTAALALACLLTAAFHPRTRTAAAAAPTQTPPACEGNACGQVTLTFDGEQGLYRAQNNSSDRWVRVSAANAAASADACLGPGNEGYLRLKSIAGAFRAEYSEPKCGAQGVRE